jgi:DNA invertase Pin-like site-specific DNA recombinase
MPYALDPKEQRLCAPRRFPDRGTRSRHLFFRYLRWVNGFGLRCTGRIKLTQEKADAIRTVRAAGWSVRDLAALFDVEVTAVYRVLSGKTWRGAKASASEAA